METWQKEHIRKHLPDLIFTTVCSHMFLAKLLSDGLLSTDDVDSLGTIKSNGEKSMQFYQIIQTRSKSFSSLKQALRETTQSGAYDILNGCSQGEDSSLKLCGSIAYDKDALLGSGCNNTSVFKGKFEDREVAVKVISNRNINKDIATNEIRILTKLDWHENAVRYFKSETTNKYVLIALELCDIDLHDWVLKPVSERKFQLEAEEIIYQVTKGIQHLHENRVVHRDLKPANILLVRQATGVIRVKISDFGMARRLPDGKSRMSVHTSGVGTEGWMAPEVMKPAYVDDNHTGMGFASDIFSLGCVYYFILTAGLHPFGDEYRRQGNILDGKLELREGKIAAVKVGTSSQYISLIRQMVTTHDQKQRPTVHDVISHLARLGKTPTHHVARQSQVQDRSNQKPVMVPRKTPSNSAGQAFNRGVHAAVPCSNEKYTASKPSSSVANFVKKFNSNHFLIREHPSSSKANKADHLVTNQLPIHSTPTESSKWPGIYSNPPQVRTQNPPNHAVDGPRRTYQAETYPPEEIIKELKISPPLTETSFGTLEDAINAKDENAIKALVKQGNAVNARDNKLRTPLHLAAISDDKGFALSIIKLLIDNRADAFATDRDQYTFLDRMVDDGTSVTPTQFHDITTYLISKGLIQLFQDNFGSGKKMNIFHWENALPEKARQEIFGEMGGNKSGSSSRISTTLKIAVKNLEVKESTLSLLQKNGIDFNAVNDFGESILFYAVIGKRSVRVISYLVSLGAKLDKKSYNNSSLLHFAAVWGNLEIVKYFVNICPSQINEANLDGNVPLHFAVFAKNEEWLDVRKHLVQNGANLNVANKSGLGPLTTKNLKEAVHALDEDEVKCHLILGENINQVDTDTTTLLHRIAGSKDTQFAVKAVQLLINNGADPNIKNSDSDTFLDLLMMQAPTPSQFQNLATFLVSKNLSTMFNTKRDSFPMCTPFQVIVANLDVEAASLSLLQKNGVDLNAIDTIGSSVLYYAINRERSPRLLSDLVSHGANPTYIDRQLCSYLHHAAQKGTVEHLKFFINVGLDVNARDENGRTPLYFAAGCYQPQNRLETIRILIQNGANRNYKDNDGCTPLDHMKKYNNFPGKEEALCLLGGGPI